MKKIHSLKNVTGGWDWKALFCAFITKLNIYLEAKGYDPIVLDVCAPDVPGPDPDPEPGSGEGDGGMGGGTRS